MNSSSKQIATVDAYIAEYSGDLKDRMEKLRALIKQTLPDAIEDISYKMPAYRAKPGKRPFLFFGATKDHIGLYALHGRLSPDLQKKVAPHVTGKGTLQFPHDEPLPMDLLKEIVAEQRQELTA